MSQSNPIILFPLPALLLAGCFSFAQSAPEKQRFAFTATRPTAEAPIHGGPILLVRPATTAPGFAERAFVVRLSDQRFEQDVYHELFTPPADALADAAREWLTRAGMFAAVFQSGSAVVPTHRLELDLRTLHVDLRDPTSPTAVLEIAWFLITSDSARLLEHGTVRSTAHAQDASGVTLASAYEKALADALLALEQALRKALLAPGR